MNSLRNSLIGAILVVVFLLFVRWGEFQERQYEKELADQETISSSVDLPSVESSADTSPSQVPVIQAEASGDTSDVPTVTTDATISDLGEASLNQTGELINVTTDVYDILIDPVGGDIVKVALLKHMNKQGPDGTPFILLNNSNSHTYIAQSGIAGPNATDTKQGRAIYSSAKSNYLLEDNQNILVVDLYLQQENARVIKRYTFNRSSYLIDVEFEIDNRDTKPWVGYLWGRIKRDSYVPRTDTGFGMAPFLGAATTTNETNYEKFKLDKIAEDFTGEPKKFTKQGGWIAMVQHYYVGAWIPNLETTNSYSISKRKNEDIYELLFIAEDKTVVPANASGSIKSSFYAGPKNVRVMEQIAPYLDLTIDFSWLWFIAKPLYFGLDIIHGFVGNWGVAIIILTLFIKILFFYPSAISFRSMAKMRKIQPLMADLKERYGEDRQKMSTELMKLYRKEKVNPLSGCLPILMQMPVFISLYWVLMESVELRHAPFMLWITDLSTKDPYFILPLIMGATMYIQTKLNPTPPDPMQAKVMQMMPIFFTFLFMLFPAGLVLYWVVNNALSIAQQYVITKQIENSDS